MQAALRAYATASGMTMEMARAVADEFYEYNSLLPTTRLLDLLESAQHRAISEPNAISRAIHGLDLQVIALILRERHRRPYRTGGRMR
jgi:hypothetical protein